MTVNTEVLEAVLTHIKDHPEEHDQAIYFCSSEDGCWTDNGTWCGTAACFAGWTAIKYAQEYGYQPRARYSRTFVKGGRERHVSEVAEDILGLSESDAGWLFCAYNTIEDLEVMVKNLIDGRTISDGVVDRRIMERAADSEAGPADQ